ncbi:MAG: TniQ family protein, partial [Candidatus Dormibacteraceae bacterium]
MLLEALTQRTDLHLLTAQAWVGSIPVRRFLRERPAWCPACYAAWKEQVVPLYEPLIWMLKTVLICPTHKCWLEDRCPNCYQQQPFLRADTKLGECIHCTTWLGRTSPPVPEHEEDTAIMDWQEWVFLSLEELRNRFAVSGKLPWERFFPNLGGCLEGRGEKYQLARSVGLEPRQFMQWLYRSSLPSLERLLEFCYVCGVTPLQVLLGDQVALRCLLDSGTSARLPRPQRMVRRVNRQRCLELIQAVLNGRE